MYKMLEVPQWILWGRRNREGKITKVPIGKNGRATSYSNPKCWKTFKQAIGEYMNGTSVGENSIDGVGFCITEDDPYVAIDLDNLNKWNGWQEIVEKFHSYTEHSPSGEGLHIWCKGYIPDERHCVRVGSHETGGIEVYDAKHYMTVTLSPAATAKTCEIVENMDAIHWLVKSMDDRRLISNVLQKDTDKKFQSLWSGNWKKLYPSQSEAELAFCRILANNHAPMHQIDRIYRQSKLYRAKWNEKRGTSTYGEMTLTTATE